MAEDQVINDEEIQGGMRSPQRRRVYGGYKKRTCNVRIEELAKPRRWYMLSTWREHGEIFDPDRMQTFKEKIQEEFSMTPEETELYFSQLRRRAGKSQRKNAMEKQKRRDKAEGKHEAYKIFRQLLRKAMTYAFKHPPPPIVSPMIRYISNAILEELCEIHHAEMPSRDSKDKFSQFLVSVADWTAFVVSNVYYEVDVNEKVDVERLKELEKLSRSTISKEDETTVRGGEETGEREGEDEDVGREEVQVKREPLGKDEDVQSVKKEDTVEEEESETEQFMDMLNYGDE